MITIVDYGLGNLGSIKNMLKYIGVQSNVESDPDKIKNASKIILPGVGSFDSAMNKINQHNLKEVLDEKALKEQVPILGICLGMQLLTNSSEEGALSGFGWIPAATKRFQPKIEDKIIRIPHMGWNVVDIHNAKSPLALGFDSFDEVKFYFVHSYFVIVENECCSIMKTCYGIKFDTAIQKDNIFGVQFHPEKSHKFGIKLLDNFRKI